MSDTTLAIIKPDAVRQQKTGEIITRINEAGFSLVSLKMTSLTTDQAKKFYAVHQGKSFFDGLIEFMTSGPVFAMILQKENAVADFRQLLGATDPSEAPKGSIRHDLGTNVQQNAVHASDSNENAEKEAAFFFASTERFNEQGGIF